MKLSEFVEYLEALKDDYGDREVFQEYYNYEKDDFVEEPLRLDEWSYATDEADPKDPITFMFIP